MSFRGFIGAVIGGSIGLGLFVWLTVLDESRPGSELPKGDIWFWIFAFTWVLELVALIAIGMYQVAPWVTRILRDDFETYWILKEKNQHYSLIVGASSVAVLIRAIVRAIDAGAVTESVGLGVFIALLPYVLPRPKVKSESRVKGKA